MAVSLRQACPALAAVTEQGAGLRLDFLNLAAELKFSVLLHMGGALLFLVWLEPLYTFSARAAQSIAQRIA